MKVLSVVILLSLSFAALAEDVKVGVNGMVCSMCAQGISKKFSSLPVQELKVDLDKKEVTFKTEKAGSVTDAQIKKLIEESGYVVTTVERK